MTKYNFLIFLHKLDIAINSKSRMKFLISYTKRRQINTNNVFVIN